MGGVAGRGSNVIVAGRGGMHLVSVHVTSVIINPSLVLLVWPSGLRHSEMSAQL